MAPIAAFVLPCLIHDARVQFKANFGGMFEDSPPDGIGAHYRISRCDEVLWDMGGLMILYVRARR
jgi:hypothetical protein